MKKFYKYFLPLVFCCVCLVLTASPVSAAIATTDPTWFDYTVVPSGGGNYIATFTPSNTDYYWERYLGAELRYTNSKSSEWLDQASQVRLLDNIYYMIYPFGHNVFVDLHGIALDDPKFQFSLDLTSISDPNASFDMKLTAYQYAYPGDGTGDIVHGNTSSSVTLSYVPGKSSYTFDLSFSLEDAADWPDGVNTIPLAPVYKFEFINLDDQSSTVQVSYDLSASLSFDVIVDQNYANYLLELKGQDASNNIVDGLGNVNDQLGNMNQELGDMNEELGNMNDELGNINGAIGDTNEKLEDIINGDVNPIAPPGSGDVDGVVDAEDALLNDAVGNYQDNEASLDQGFTLLKQLFPALIVVTRIMNLFLAFDFFKFLTYISLSLGVLAALLNIGANLIHRSDSSARSGKKGE